MFLEKPLETLNSVVENDSRKKKIELDWELEEEDKLKDDSINGIICGLEDVSVIKDVCGLENICGLEDDNICGLENYLLNRVI